MDQIKIGNFISFLRKEKNLTQRQLADVLGVTDRAISKWENGRGLPDLSLLVPLCETLGITVNELLCGERIKREDLPQKAQDTVLDALTDSRKKERRTKRIFVAVLLSVLLLFFSLATLFGIDVNQMRQNKPTVFSTWGFDYCPPVDLSDETIHQAVESAMLLQDQADLNRLIQDGTVPLDRKPFVRAHIYLIEEKPDHFLVYAWVKGTTYYVDSGKLLADGGYSIPYRFTLTEQDGTFTVTEKQHPRDGSLYAQDMKTLFPASVRRQITRTYWDGTAARLTMALEEQAKLYFHLS